MIHWWCRRVTGAGHTLPRVGPGRMEAPLPAGAYSGGAAGQQHHLLMMRCTRPPGAGAA